MDQNKLIEEYPFLEDKDFKLPKLSIFELMEKDKLEDDRAYLLDRFNEWSDTDDDAFYWEMLACVKFILDENAVAYTTRDHIISLSYPSTDMVPQDNQRWRRWYFIYCHECLHQLWETFKVEDEIKKEKGKCNHDVLNIASDCVINDFLKAIGKSNKIPPIGGIFPEVLKEKFNVDYDRKVDTQYTLYCKLVDVYEKNQQQMQEMIDELKKMMGDDAAESNNSSSSSSSSSGSSNSNSSNSSSGSNNSSSDQNGNDSDGEGNGDGKDSKNAGKDGNGNDKSGDQNGDGENKSGNKDGDGENKSGNKDGAGDKSGKPSGQSEKGGSEKDAGNDIGDLYDRSFIESIKRKAEEICKKYADSIVGSISTFTSQCKSSKKMTRPDLIVNSPKGNTSWVKEVTAVCRAYVKNKLYHQKQYRDTYSRIKRGSRPFTAQDMKNRRLIIQGREEVKNKIGFDIAMYIDTSGSMDNCIEHVFEASWGICDKLKKDFGQESIVDKNKINLRSYVFTTAMKEITYGRKCTAGGGTYEFDRLLSDIHKNEAEAFLNIVITDGEFGSINENEILNVLETLEGMFVLVVNNKSNESSFVSLEKKANAKFGTKFKVIFADSDFSIK